MKKIVVLLLGLTLLGGLCSTLAAAEKVNLYANITAIEPIMADFNAGQSAEEGIYTRISTAKYLATVLTEFSAGKTSGRRSPGSFADYSRCSRKRAC